jgi:hypothetical protein
MIFRIHQVGPGAVETHPVFFLIILSKPVQEEFGSFISV